MLTITLWDRLQTLLHSFSYGKTEVSKVKRIFKLSKFPELVSGGARIINPNRAYAL